MVNLVHEIWEDIDEDGHPLPGCCLAGPDGDGFRRLLGPNACLVHTFEAASHFEAMTIYNRFLGQRAYSTDHPEDLQPYPTEWATRQNPLRR